MRGILLSLVLVGLFATGGCTSAPPTPATMDVSGSPPGAPAVAIFPHVKNFTVQVSDATAHNGTLRLLVKVTPEDGQNAGGEYGNGTVALANGTRLALRRLVSPRTPHPGAPESGRALGENATFLATGYDASVGLLRLELRVRDAQMAETVLEIGATAIRVT